jgi:hypothetical protein
MRRALDCLNTEATIASARASYPAPAALATTALGNKQGSWLTAVPSAASKFVRPNHTAMIRFGGPGGSS